MPRNPVPSPGPGRTVTTRLRVFTYNRFVGAAQGSTGSQGWSNLAINDPNRTAKTVLALGLPGILGISYTGFWETIEPVAPVGGVHTYVWDVLDLALAETQQYPGCAALFRVNGGNGNAGTPNWLSGGGTDRLTAQPATGQKVFNLPGRSAATLPAVGSIVTINAPPGQSEGTAVTAVNVGTGDVTLTGNINFVHNAGGIVEWTKIAQAWAAHATYQIGDIIIAPAGSVVLDGRDVGNLRFVCTQPVADSGASFVTAGVLTIPTMCELVQFSTTTGGIFDTMPVPWDPNLIAARNALTAAMGARYNGNPLLFTVAMSAAGYQGEIPLNSAGVTAAQVAQDVAAWLPHGYTDRRYYEAWTAMIDAYMAAFPTTALSMCTGEPWGQNANHNWPATTTLAATGANGSATVTCAGIAAADFGKMVTGVGVPPNAYVGTVTPGVQFLLTSDPTQAQVNYLAPNGGSITQVFLNGNQRTDAGATGSAASSTILDASIQKVDESKRCTGGNIPAASFVRDVVPGVSFTLSSTRLVTTPVNPTGAVAGVTIGLDGLGYGPTGFATVDGVLNAALVGTNLGGALGGFNADIYGGGAPVKGYIPSRYPNRAYIQQNGLNGGDFQKLNQGRMREVISSVYPTNPAALGFIGGAYQFGAGGNTEANIQSALTAANDDQTFYTEVYATDTDLAGLAGMQPYVGKPRSAAPVRTIAPTRNPVP